MGSFYSYFKQNDNKNQNVNMEVNNIIKFYKPEMNYLYQSPQKIPKKLRFKEISPSKLFESSSSSFELSDDTFTENKPMYSTFQFNSDSYT